MTMAIQIQKHNMHYIIVKCFTGTARLELHDNLNSHIYKYLHVYNFYMIQYCISYLAPQCFAVPYSINTKAKRRC